MVKNIPPTDAEMTAELLKLHRQDPWPGAWHFLRDTPMRRALRKAGYLELSPRGRGRWRMTLAGREQLVNYPGSGITRGELPHRRIPHG